MDLHVKTGSGVNKMDLIDMKHIEGNKICNRSLPITGYCEDWNCRYWCNYQFSKIYKYAWCVGPNGPTDCYCYITC
ncbi:hypothetical protein ACET3Z_001670 [Daucus carota]